MNISHMAGAAFRALTASKDGPSIYEVCDPVLLNGHGGDQHLAKFYKTALRNPALIALLRRAGLPELRDESRLATLRTALAQARDQDSPDWVEVGRPFADLLDTIQLSHPKPPAVAGRQHAPKPVEIDAIIQTCARHLLKSFARNGFLPTYAAFNLIGDPDFRGRELIAALTGLNARGYKNSTLMFNLARVFIARSPTGAVINPPWKGIAEPMWEPMQIRHRSAYYDAFFIEALLSFIDTGLASADEAASSRKAITAMVDFCLKTSSEDVQAHDGSTFKVVTALAPPPHPQFSRFFSQIKEKLGFGIYVPDCDTTACSFSAATQAGSNDPILNQPLLDFYASYQVRPGSNEPLVTVPLNDNIDYDGAIATWIDNLAGERPYGNDLDPTLNLDVLEVSFRNCERWKVLETPSRLDIVHSILRFQRRLAESGAFADPRSHIYYLPELYSAYFGRCYAAFKTLPETAQRIIDPDDSFGFIRTKVLTYVYEEIVSKVMNPFDAALALLALGHLDGARESFTPALQVIAEHIGEGGYRAPFKAYEWNKMKTPTRILVGGPEVTSAFVLMGLAVARQALQQKAR
jgi:hypothetical protein